MEFRVDILSAERLGISATNPRLSIPYILLAVSLVRLDLLEEAKEMTNIVVELDPSFTMARWSATVGVVPDVFTPFADAWRELGMAA
jgi:hypothetical protein